ncbi:uncharacterized protein LOC126314440 [Schistocerca gregaria]|uniref:uncharacterized protein LOC126314440 n=1 Tax=Schistocerca gregaria TaxID=7010 RepID=UPI00211F118C|nr:uncharacterized protein LOC126314440 [Schistocerca gregaria]
MNDYKGKAEKKKEVPVIWTELQYKCDYCNKDISNTIRIRCTECTDELDLCLECFCVGVEIKSKSHYNNHCFRLIDNMQFPLFDRSWSVDEEQLMLEGLDQDGWANWEDVSGNIMTKTKNEIRAHYTEYYLNSPKWPLPDFDKKLVTRDDVKRINFNPALLDTISPRERGIHRKSTKVVYNKPQPSKPVHHDLANYMPLRGEFEVEWNNDAEHIIKDIMFEPDEPPNETEIKLKLLEIYCIRLNERDEKRQFVLERNLHDIKKMKELEKKRSKEEREIRMQTRKFNSIMSENEYERFVENLVAEANLKQKIKEFNEYRLMGMRSMADIYKHKAELAQNEASTLRRGRPVSSSRRNMHQNSSSSFKNNFSFQMSSNAPDLMQLGTTTLRSKTELLSQLEKDLIAYLSIKSETYLSIKNMLIREYTKSGEIHKSQLRQIGDPREVRVAEIVFDFIQEIGWINVRPTANQFNILKNASQAVCNNFNPSESNNNTNTANITNNNTPNNVTQNNVTNATTNNINNAVNNAINNAINNAASSATNNVTNNATNNATNGNVKIVIYHGNPHSPASHSNSNSNQAASPNYQSVNNHHLVSNNPMYTSSNSTLPGNGYPLSSRINPFLNPSPMVSKIPNSGGGSVCNPNSSYGNPQEAFNSGNVLARSKPRTPPHMT